MSIAPQSMIETVRSLLAAAAGDGRTILLEPEVYALLAVAGIGVPAHRVVAAPEAVTAGLCQGFPSARVVVKVVSPEILHKSDVGGVAFCENRPDAVRRTVSAVLGAVRAKCPAASLRGVLIAEEVAFKSGLGREILAGLRHDPAFGPVVFAGAGGLDVEFLQAALPTPAARALFATAGLGRDEVRAGLRGTMIDAARAGVLRSARGRPAPEDAIVDLVLALAALAEVWAGFAPPLGLGLAELEVNPFVIDARGKAVALDGLARLHRPVALPPLRPLHQLRRLFTPTSAAVLGASAQALNPGRVILQNLIRGGGVPRERIWAIHPKAEAIEGCRAFPDLAALPEAPDLAVVSVPAAQGENLFREIAGRGLAHTVILITGGFGETEGGRAAEAAIRRIIGDSRAAPGGGVLVNGGNCLGIVSGPGGYNTFFLPEAKLPVADLAGGNVASLSQSGAYLVTQMSNLEDAVRLRYAVSFGNQVDLTVSDHLEFLERDPEVAVYAVYLEGFRPGDGRRFLDVARRIAAGGRPVVLYKAGRTREGGQAAASHTASAVGDYAVCRELARAAGVVACASLEDFEDALVTFSRLAGRRASGRRVAVVSNAGFECTVAADTLGGLTLAELAPETRARLAELLPRGVVDVRNPADTTPLLPTESYAGVAAALAADPGTDALIVAGVPVTGAIECLERGEGHDEDLTRPTSLASRLIKVFQASAKPMVFSVDAGRRFDACARMMQRAGLPTFRKVDRAVRALEVFLGAR